MMKTKTYAHFLSNGISQLGSDAWCRVDGRKSLWNQKQEAIEQMKRLSVVKPHYDGFEIHQGGGIRSTQVVYRCADILGVQLTLNF